MRGATRLVRARAPAAFRDAISLLLAVPRVAAVAVRRGNAGAGTPGHSPLVLHRSPLAHGFALHAVTIARTDRLIPHRPPVAAALVIPTNAMLIRRRMITPRITCRELDSMRAGQDGGAQGGEWTGQAASWRDVDTPRRPRCASSRERHLGLRSSAGRAIHFGEPPPQHATLEWKRSRRTAAFRSRLRCRWCCDSVRFSSEEPRDRFAALPDDRFQRRRKRRGSARGRRARRAAAVA
jgi:hypothetical protein